jgi:hypothetical protein
MREHESQCQEGVLPLHNPKAAFHLRIRERLPNQEDVNTNSLQTDTILSPEAATIENP